jgi:[acyl-carrier-protein] S-malonyltransferase
VVTVPAQHPTQPFSVPATAFLFPGQSSQKVGMGHALHDADGEARALFAEADAVLGFSLSKLCFEGPEAELTLTANAQPAILTVSVAALRVLRGRTGLVPVAVAGHSLGEYSALVAAGALKFADAVRLVHLRGKFMQEAVPAGTGAMAAILGLGAEEVAAACREAAGAEVVSPANLNGGGQVVIAGHKAAVERACAAAKARGAKRAVPLAVSAPFHCALMQPAAEKLAGELGRVPFAPLEVPLVSNVDAEPNQDPARARELLVQQVTAPVRWEESVHRLAALGVARAVEVGAGNVLAGLVRRIAPAITVHGAGDPQAIAELAVELANDGANGDGKARQHG